MQIPRVRLNLLEAAIIGGGMLVIAYFAGSHHASGLLAPYISPAAATELHVLEDRYGQEHNSQFGEEWIVRDFFQDARSGTFVDVGANHYRNNSNTYYLETVLGWSGLAIEPQTKFAPEYAKYRAKTIFIPLFVSDRSNEKATLYVPPNDLVASADRSMAELSGSPVPTTVNTTTLDDVLTRAGLQRIDFLSIDVELHEPEVLKGFSISRWRPALVCIESHPPVRQQELDYFAARHYVVVGKYLRADSANLWFRPMGAPGAD